MLSLKNIKINNAGRFVGSHFIDFENRPSLIQVDAQNKNTGGSSGSGKSTIFNAIEYLLGTNSIPATVLQSRLTKDPLEVEGEFAWEDKTLKIIRSKSNGLSIQVNGVDLVSGNNKAAEEKLDEILGISRELLRKMTHKRQKEGGFFLNLTPKETHAFLIEALDLQTWAKRAEKAEADIKKHTQEIASLDVEISYLSSSLQTNKANLQAQSKPQLDWNPELLASLEDRVKISQQEEMAISEQMQKDLSSISRPTPPPAQDRSSLVPLKSKIAELRARDTFEKQQQMIRLQSLNKELSEQELSLSKLRRAIELGKASEKRLDGIKAQIVSIKNGICPTCKQAWHQHQKEFDLLVEEAKKEHSIIQGTKSLELEIPAAEKAILDTKESIAVFQSQALATSPLSFAIQDAENALALKTLALDNELKLTNQAYQDQLVKVSQQEQEIRIKYQDSLGQASYNTQQYSKLFIEKKTELASYEKSLELYAKNIEILSKSIEDQEAQLKNKQTLKEKTEENLAIATDALALIKSYTNTLFQSALDQIATKATSILSQIPNMSTASIYFEGFKETKTGTIKEEVSAILTMDGEINIPIKSMSGGERTAIDLAVDLAVIEMVEQLAGKGLDIFILDEPFDGLDSTCKEQSLEILKTYVTDKKIIIVDHSNETKELVTDRILVVRDGQQSSVL